MCISLELPQTQSLSSQWMFLFLEKFLFINSFKLLHYPWDSPVDTLKIVHVIVHQSSKTEYNTSEVDSAAQDRILSEQMFLFYVSNTATKSHVSYVETT